MLLRSQQVLQVSTGAQIHYPVGSQGPQGARKHRAGTDKEPSCCQIDGGSHGI